MKNYHFLPGAADYFPTTNNFLWFVYFGRNAFCIVAKTENEDRIPRRSDEDCNSLYKIWIVAFTPQTPPLTE